MQNGGQCEPRHGFRRAHVGALHCVDRAALAVRSHYGRRRLLAVSLGAGMSTANAFNWRAFVQPCAVPRKPPASGNERPGYIAPRAIVQGDAKATRLALNSSGKFVQVRMDVTSTSIAAKSDRWGEYV